MFYLQSRFQIKPFSLQRAFDETTKVYVSPSLLSPYFRIRNHALQTPRYAYLFLSRTNSCAVSLTRDYRFTPTQVCLPDQIP